MSSGGPEPLAVVRVLREEAEAIADDWHELCRWDPMLPPESRPPIAPALIAAMADALEHPQPLGWGADPEMDKVVGIFATSSGSLEVAIGQLVCLGEALRRRVGNRIPAEQAAESYRRLEMLIDRAIGAAAQQAATRIEGETLVDGATALLNRHALVRDLRREMARATRYKRRFSLLLLRLTAGDDNAGLRTFAGVLRDTLRAGDLAYRVEGGEFAAVLAETESGWGKAVAGRLQSGEASPFRWGEASFPNDGDDPETLLEIARSRLEANE